MMNARFMRCYSEANKNAVDRTGRVYYVKDEHENVHKIGYSVPRSSKNLRYIVWPQFVARFSAVLPVGTVHKWNSKLEFEAWIHKQIFSSWAVLSHENTCIPWFLKGIIDVNKTVPTLMPAEYQHLFDGANKNRWILLQSGWKVYPVYVVKNRLSDGWQRFECDHNLAAGFVVMFGAKKGWIFDVKVFDGNQKMLSYSWTKDKSKINTVIPQPGNLMTMFSSSTFVSSIYQVEFGLYYISNEQLYQELRRQFRIFLADDNVTELKFEMGHIKWVEQKHGHDMKEDCALTLMKILNLKKHDFIYMAATDPTMVKVLIFDAKNGTERHCS